MKAVLTTINEPSDCTRGLVTRLEGNELIVIGDEKTPEYKLDGATFIHIDNQDGFRLSKLLPRNTYCRKNIGYLMAMKDNDLIYETDDDNTPLVNWKIPKKTRGSRLVGGKRFVNVYNYFTDEHVWPRGLPLEYSEDNSEVLRDMVAFYPVQQGLVNGSPDVDAIWRLLYDYDFTFYEGRPVSPSEYLWCPFNAQNTWWFKEAFPLMYLPFTCSFRMTDIWRSFIAQRILWGMGYRMLFFEADVIQVRNYHDYYDDFKQEIPGYLGNNKLQYTLENVVMSGDVYEILYNCYDKLIEEGFFMEGEISLVERWIEDCKRILV